MSNAIRFLEQMGATALVGQAFAADYNLAVEALRIDTRQQQALLDRDVQTLNGLLDGRAWMHCMVVAPDSEEQQDAPLQDEDEFDGDKEPEKE